MRNEFAIKYDDKIFDPGIQYLYQQNNFYNVGDWRSNPKTITEACENLTKRHIYDENNQQIKASNILDIGCGLGSGAELIASLYPAAKVTAINISEQQIKKCRQKQDSKVDFKVMDAAHLDFDDSNFDLITSIEAAFHFNTRKKFLASSYKKLKEGGYLIFTDILFFDTTYVGEWSVPSANNILDLDEYNKICNAIGFTITSQEDITKDTWKSFCDFVNHKNSQKMQDLSENLKKSVAYYLITKLKK